VLDCEEVLVVEEPNTFEVVDPVFEAGEFCVLTHRTPPMTMIMMTIHTSVVVFMRSLYAAIG
jgi:hypothetical protein